MSILTRLAAELAYDNFVQRFRSLGVALQINTDILQKTDIAFKRAWDKNNGSQEFVQNITEIQKQLDNLVRDIKDNKIKEQCPYMFKSITHNLSNRWPQTICGAHMQRFEELMTGIYKNYINTNYEPREIELKIELAKLDIRTLMRITKLDNSYLKDELFKNFLNQIRAEKLTLDNAIKVVDTMLQIQELVLDSNISVIAHKSYNKVSQWIIDLLHEPQLIDNTSVDKLIKDCNNLRTEYEEYVTGNEQYKQYISSEDQRKYNVNYVSNTFGDDVLPELQRKLNDGILTTEDVSQIIDALINVHITFRKLLQQDLKEKLGPEYLKNVTAFDEQTIDSLKQHLDNPSYITVFANNISNAHGEWIRSRNYLKNNLYDNIRNNAAIKDSSPGLQQIYDIIAQHNLDDFLGFPRNHISNCIRRAIQVRNAKGSKIPKITSAKLRSIINALISLKDGYDNIVKFIDKRSKEPSAQIPDFMRQVKSKPKDFFDGLSSVDLNNKNDFSNPINLYSIVHETIKRANMEAKGIIDVSEYKDNDLEDTTNAPVSHDKEMERIREGKNYTFILDGSDKKVTINIIPVFNNEQDFATLAKLRGRKFTDKEGNIIRPWNDVLNALANPQINDDEDYIRKSKVQRDILARFLRRYSQNINKIETERLQNTQDKVYKEFIAQLGYGDDTLRFLQPYIEQGGCIDKYGRISILMVAFQKAAPELAARTEGYNEEGYADTDRSDANAAFNIMLDAIDNATDDFKRAGVKNYTALVSLGVTLTDPKYAKCRGLVAQYPPKQILDKYGNIWRTMDYKSGRKSTSSKYKVEVVTAKTVFDFFKAAAFTSVREGTAERFSWDEWGPLRSSTVNPNRLTPDQQEAIQKEKAERKRLNRQIDKEINQGTADQLDRLVSEQQELYRQFDDPLAEKEDIPPKKPLYKNVDKNNYF